MASMPEARDGKATRGMVGGGGYIPRFRNLVKGKPDRDFLRGYAMDFSTGGTPDPKYFPLYGEALDKAVASYRGSAISATIMGEALARYENHVTINKEVKDAFAETSVLIRKIAGRIFADDIGNYLQSAPELIEKMTKLETAIRKELRIDEAA